MATGHIRPGGKNSWKIFIYVGKGRYKCFTTKGKRRDAERERTRLLEAMHNGSYVEPTKMTLAEFVERWLSDYAAQKVSPKTAERYTEIPRKHLIPALGKHPLTKLHPLHIQAYYTEALKTGRRDGRGGLSGMTVKHHHRLLREILQQAVKWQLLVRNPCDGVEPPRPARTEMQALDETETIAVIHATQGTRLHLTIAIAAMTGLRRGEILALRWADWDHERATIAVCQSLEETEQGLRFKQPKSGRKRLVTLPTVLNDLLRKHKAEQAAARLSAGPVYKDHGLICAQPDGQPWKPSVKSLAFTGLLERQGLRRIRFHDLRHTHASQLLLKGIHPKVVSERLGHSGVGITLDTYSHLLPGLQEEAARRIDEAYGGAVNR